jgi:hypothetical protein
LGGRCHGRQTSASAKPDQRRRHPQRRRRRARGEEFRQLGGARLEAFIGHVATLARYIAAVRGPARAGTEVVQ